MMKKIVLLNALLLLSVLVSAATITVNLNPNSGADFNDAQSAVNAATTGDVIYLQSLANSSLFLPTTLDYGTVVIDKQITLVGHGYFIEEAGFGDYSESFLSVPVLELIVNDLGAGAVIRNLEIQTLTVQGPDVTVRNCFIQNGVFNGATNATVFSCYFESPMATVSALSMTSSTGGQVFDNCFFGYSGDLADDAVVVDAIMAFGAEFDHCNIVNGNAQLGDHFVHNCIFYESQITYIENGMYNNNVFTTNPFVTPLNPLGLPQDGTPVFGDPTNQQVGATDLFTFEGDADAQWRLQPLSPAVGAADDGDNVGMFTAGDSYVIAGFPDDGPVFIEVDYLQLITTQIELPIQFAVLSPSGNTISEIQWTVIPDDFFVGTQNYSNFTPSTFVNGFISLDVDALPVQGVFALNAIDDAGLESGFQFFPYQKDQTPLVTPNLQFFEYYYNTDPGVGNGNLFDLSPETDFEGIVTFQTLVQNGPNPGQNTLFVRAVDEFGEVGTTYYHEFEFITGGVTADCCDIDGDGFVGGSDFLAFLQFLSQPVSGCDNGDFNQDGMVDIGDLLILLSFYGTTV